MGQLCAGAGHVEAIEIDPAILLTGACHWAIAISEHQETRFASCATVLANAARESRESGEIRTALKSARFPMAGLAAAFNGLPPTMDRRSALHNVLPRVWIELERYGHRTV